MIVSYRNIHTQNDIDVNKRCLFLFTSYIFIYILHLTPYFYLLLFTSMTKCRRRLSVPRVLTCVTVLLTAAVLVHTLVDDQAGSVRLYSVLHVHYLHLGIQ